MRQVSRTEKSMVPGYPNRREHLDRKALLGAFVVGVGALVAGCTTRTMGNYRPEPQELSRPSATATPPAVAQVSTNTVIDGGLPCELTPVPPGAPPVPAPMPSSDKAPSERLMIYVVQKGDTLSAIAERWLGGASRWPEIVKVNPGLVPEKLKVGRAIRLPVAGAKPVE